MVGEMETIILVKMEVQTLAAEAVQVKGLHLQQQVQEETV